MRKDLKRILAWQKFKNWCYINNKKPYQGEVLKEYINRKRNGDLNI